MYGMTCPLQNAPLPHQKAKARNLKRNFNRYLETYYRQRGIPRLMVQHPAQAHPQRLAVSLN